MTQASKKHPLTTELASDRHGKHKLDKMEPRMARNLVMFRPSEKALLDLLATASREIPGLAEPAEVLRIFRHNPDFVLALTRKTKFASDSDAGEGFIAMLPLNMLGLQHLALGTFNAASPDVRLLAAPDEKPAGVYLWGVYAPGPLVAGMALFMQKMATEQYSGVDIYSRPNTEAGIRFNHGMGFVRGTTIGTIEAPNVWKFPRKPIPPIYDSYVPGAGKKELGITVARTFDDLMRVMAIRSAVYMSEQECPYDEEYDGNDLSATHLLAYIGDEPVGCLRLRFFADFVKFERMAIRKEFRKSRAAVQLTKACFEFCRKKGYRRLYGHAQKRLVNFWDRFGFQVVDGSKGFVFSGFDYVEMVAELEPDPHAIAMGSDPYVLIRPEGRWHVPGILEKSAAREVSPASTAKKA